MVSAPSIRGTSTPAMDATPEARRKEMLDEILARLTEMASDLKACSADLKSISAAFGSAPPTSVPDLGMGVVTTNSSAEQALASCGIFDRDGDSIATDTGASVVADNWGGFFDEIPTFAYDYEPVSLPDAASTGSDDLPVVPLEVVQEVAIVLPHGSKSLCHDSVLSSTAGMAAAPRPLQLRQQRHAPLPRRDFTDHGVCLGFASCGVLFYAHSRSADRGVHHHVRLGFAVRGELLRVDKDGHHVSWFEAAAVDFESVRCCHSPARYTIQYAHLLTDVDGVLAAPFMQLSSDLVAVYASSSAAPHALLLASPARTRLPSSRRASLSPLPPRSAGARRSVPTTSPVFLCQQQCSLHHQRFPTMALSSASKSSETNTYKPCTANVSSVQQILKGTTAELMFLFQQIDYCCALQIHQVLPATVT